MKNTNKGITLIALVITVIVLLILAGTAISIALNGNNIFEKTNAAVGISNAKAEEQGTNITQVDTTFNTWFDQYNTSHVSTELRMTLDGVEVTEITQANFAQYLGKVVTNYSGAATEVDEKTVSNTYRLYWIDWTNKYGDGAGTIYLKADCTSNYYALSRETTTETIDPVNSVMRKLNPELYKSGNTPPAVNSDSMKAVRWLLNPDNWFDDSHETKLTHGLAPSIAAKVNYVVGAPCLEMMMDSYNAHYGLTNETMDLGIRDESTTTRTKLGYIYPLNSNNYGYGVGPSRDSNATNGYYNYTSNATVQTDTENPSIDSMYYPGTDQSYWIASPTSSNSSSVILVNYWARWQFD